MSLLELAVEAARTAGALQRERFDTRFEVRHKGAIDLVTEVDVACETAIRELLREHTPEASILGEEEGREEYGSELLWLVDPLDGTTNYAHGLPVFCAVVALEQAGELKLGVIYDPMRDELFIVEAGKGAFLNGKPLRVTEKAKIGDCLLATGFPYNNPTSERENFTAFAKLTRASHGVRRLGSAALDLAYVAAGRFDGFWEIGLNPWDVAAGTLLVREAGGNVTGLHGQPYNHHQPDILATNGLIHEEATCLLGNCL